MTEQRRPVALLVNPGAGGKPGAGDALEADVADLEPDALAAALVRRGLDVRPHLLDGPMRAVHAARDAVRDGHDVVVAGGDGTVSQAAASLFEAGEGTLGILPLGSFNNIARGLGIPGTLAGALDVVAAGRSSAVDVGWAYRDDRADGRPFFEAAGVGIDAVGFMGAELMERHGFARALRAVWRGLRRGGRRMSLTLDETSREVDTPGVIVSNGPYHGMGFAIAGEADPADGVLDVAVFERMSRLTVLRHFLAVSRRRPRREPGVTVERASRVRIESVGRAIAAHADGESIGVTPVSFEVRPGALRVFR